MLKADAKCPVEGCEPDDQPLGHLNNPVCRYEGTAGSRVRNGNGNLSGIGIVQGLCANCTHSSMILRLDNALQHWMSFHILRGLCIVLPSPLENEAGCRLHLSGSIESLVRCIMHHKGNHYVWVRSMMSVPENVDIVADTVRQAITVRLLPEWLRLVSNKDSKKELPKYLALSIYGRIF